MHYLQVQVESNVSLVCSFRFLPLNLSVNLTPLAAEAKAQNSIFENSAGQSRWKK